MLIVKGVRGYGVIVATSTSAPSTTDPRVLRGTAVVPGAGYGPALLARGEVSPAALLAFGTGDFADGEAALAAYDDAAAGWRQASPRRPPARRVTPPR